ncbi:MAG: hypothetical protein M1826_007556 [Phylliscum demangeonii]|nr:MAG: hypothetical protein M1826_007556 [Phylliscum demangeonii]
MPPRSSLTSSFSVSDASNEVVCPLRNQDGSSCRKRCLGEKRYRSMQEHIRRAHPAYYISKLPATEESFALMINTPPSDRPRESSAQGLPSSSATYGLDVPMYAGPDESSSPATPRNHYVDDYAAAAVMPPAATTAAAALAQLHGHKLEAEWESEPETMSENDVRYRPSKGGAIELPGIAQMKQQGLLMSPYDPTRPRNLLPSILSKSPPGRSSTLPPIQRREKTSRSRKSSVTQHARRPQHDRKSSRGEHVRRMSYDGRKAFSAEPSGMIPIMGKRWEDLIDAATSATEDVDGDRTPIPHPASPPNPHRASLPPFSTAFPHSYQASPLQNALTPPSYGPAMTMTATDAPLPSVEPGDCNPEKDSSPPSASQKVQIYCAGCQTATLLRTAYACTECVCGICRDCVDHMILAADSARPGSGSASGSGTGPTADSSRRAVVSPSTNTRLCPRCGTVGGKFKPFQLDLR